MGSLGGVVTDREALIKLKEALYEIHTSDHGYCVGCGGEWVSGNEWPCETLRTLEEILKAVK